MLTQMDAESQNQIQTDWANLNKYEAENKSLLAPSVLIPRVVFMGNYIEGWKEIDSSFFASGAYIDEVSAARLLPRC